MPIGVAPPPRPKFLEPLPTGQKSVSHTARAGYDITLESTCERAPVSSGRHAELAARSETPLRSISGQMTARSLKTTRVIKGDKAERPRTVDEKGAAILRLT